MISGMLAAFSTLLIGLFPGCAGTTANQVRGDYIEARTADVYTGPCFSNAEVFITGKHAVLAWKVTEGTWKGVDLKGLTIAAAVEGSSTFSEDSPAQAKSVLIVDKTATATQREALIAMAKDLGGERLKNVVSVLTSPMSLVVEEHMDGSAERILCGIKDAHDAARPVGVVRRARFGRDFDSAPV